MSLEELIAWTAGLHAGQLYRGYGNRLDEPYIFHLLRVMMSVPPHYQRVALLHDAKEDHDTVPAGLLPSEYLAIALLSRPSEWRYTEYIDRIARDDGPGGELAKVVKIADLRDNISNGPPPALMDRYLKAHERLWYSFGGGCVDTCTGCDWRCPLNPFADLPWEEA